MKVLAIIQARVGSTRLPNKVLLPLGKKTVLENVYERVSASKLVDDVLIATTTHPSDDTIVELCKKKGMNFFRGSEEDLLDRYYNAAIEKSPEHIVRITADCPVMDPQIIDQAVKKHLKEENDFTATAYLGKETFPDGEDVDVFTFDALKEAWEKAKLPYQREHATQYFTNNADKFKIGCLSYKENLSDKRWTLDEENDYLFLQKIYEALEKPGHTFGIEEIIEYLKKNPEIEKINHHITRNEGLQKSINNDNQ